MSHRFSTDSGSRVSTYGGVLPSKNVPPMPIRTTPNGTPSIRWPIERRLLDRLVCWHCGSLVIVDDAPSAGAPMVDVACWMCSRVACELVHDSVGPRMTPEQFRALPTEQGRRRSTRRAPTAPLPPVTPCAPRVRNQQARLIALMVDGQPHRRADLAQQLGISYDALRNVVNRARVKGRRLVNERHGYLRLAVSP